MENLVKSAEDLKLFKTPARESYIALSSRDSLKRTKESRGIIGVSADTVSIRPPPKRLMQRQLNFVQNELSDSYSISKINDHD